MRALLQLVLGSARGPLLGAGGAQGALLVPAGAVGGGCTAPCGTTGCTGSTVLNWDGREAASSCFMD